MNELERLQAAHQQIPDPDPIVLSAVRERVLAADGERARGRDRERVSHRGRRHAPRTARDRAGPRTWRRFALAGAVACVLAGVTAVSIDVAPRGPGLPRLDTVEQARAALAPPGAIAHYTVALSSDANGRDHDPRYADCNAGPLEVWRAASPTRWRAVQPVSDNPSCGTMDLSQGLGPVTAPRLEVSYAAGRTSMYVPGRDLMLVIDDEKAPADGERRAPSSAASAASIQLFSTPPVRKPGHDGAEFVDSRPPDLISDVEQMLAKGELRDEGESVRDGRRVHVLTGSSERGFGDEVFERTTIEYVTDAETYAPISAKSTTVMAETGAVASTSAAFAGYERIPLDRDGATLLEIQPERKPKVIEQTIEQIKNPPR
jgi:hypothetical protein